MLRPEVGGVRASLWFPAKSLYPKKLKGHFRLVEALRTAQKPLRCGLELPSLLSD